MAAAEHDKGEEVENDTRRDDHLEREFGVTGRDFLRGSDRNDILFSEYLADRRKSREREDDNVTARTDNRERMAVSRDERDSLRFRDATAHSTAIAALEAENSVVGTEQMENVPDEEHPAGADKNAGA